MAEKAKPVHGPGGHGRQGRGARPRVENPGKILRWLLGYIMKNYALAMIVVMVCIMYSAFAMVQGTLFMEELIDGYIQPLLTSGSTDFSNLASAVFRVAGFYAVGVAASYGQSKIMIYVSH